MSLPETHPPVVILDGLDGNSVRDVVGDVSQHSDRVLDRSLNEPDRDSVPHQTPPQAAASHDAATETQSEAHKTDATRKVASSAAETKTINAEKIQEAKITRVPPEDWRRVKKGRKLDLDQSILLVSSKANVKTNLRKKRRTSTPMKKTAEPPQATGQSQQLDVPYRLAINSPYLLDAIGQCIVEQITESHNVFVRPFKFLVGYEAEIRQFYRELELAYEQAELDAKLNGKEQATLRGTADRAKRERDEFRCLLEFMDRDMADIFDVKRQISDNTVKEIAFENLWLLFRPGQIVYQFKNQDEGDRCQAYQILHVTGGRVLFDSGKKCFFDAVRERDWASESETEERCRNIVRSSDHETSSFLIDTFYTDFDGLRMGPRPKRFVIPRYAGTRPIDMLPLYPAFLHPDNSSIQEKLLARGRKFTELATGSHKKYDGFTIRESNQTAVRYYNFAIAHAELHGEVMVDQGTGIEHFKEHLSLLRGFSLRLGAGSIFNPSKADKRETFDPLPEKQDNNWVTDVADDSKYESDRYTDFVQSTELLNFQDLERAGCSDERALLLPPRVYGYSLLDHKWFALDINLLSEIPPRSLTTHFEDLVLPNGHKTLLQALVKNHVRRPKRTNDVNETFTMDLVAGKGRGLIILLHGVPGVGKTSTAECVAAELGRPLLPITCGDIGTTAREAEKSLESFCSLAQKWRCVLLLDEADVFLAKREKGDIQRNSLVSVFLRVLEYYSGVIILTTNRVGEFDEAFRSRIHISLYYPKLSDKSAKEIWQRNISRLKGSGTDIDLEEEEIESFIDRHWARNKNRPSRLWNGRQMKNAFQTAIALANWDFYEGDDGLKLKRPLLRADHFIRVAKTSAHFDDYIRDVHNIDEEDDSYSILAGREEIRKDSNPGSFPDPVAPRRSRAAGRNRLAASRVNAAKRHDRGREYDDMLTGDEEEEEEEEEEDDDVRRLQLELELAKLKKAPKKKSYGKAGATGLTIDEDDEGTW